MAVGPIFSVQLCQFSWNISRAAVSRSATPHFSMRSSSLSLLSATLRYRLPEGPPGSVAPSTSTCLARRVLPSCVKPWGGIPAGQRQTRAATLFR